MKKKISDIVVNFMVKKGLTQVFAVAGGGAMHLNDSFAKNDKITNLIKFLKIRIIPPKILLL